MGNQLRLSICVPAYNEQTTLETAVDDLIAAFTGRVVGFEVIIVDDGSTDSTGTIADSLAARYAQVRVIHHRANAGIGVSYRDALACARYDYFTWFPADHENSPAEFLACLPYLAPDTIVVNNYRASDRRPALRRLLSRAYVGAVNALFGQRITYYNGLNIIPVAVLRRGPLIANGFVFNAETVIRSVRAGCSVVELSHTLRPRAAGRSKVVSVKTFVQIAKDLTLIAFSCLRRPEVRHD